MGADKLLTHINKTDKHFTNNIIISELRH